MRTKKYVEGGGIFSSPMPNAANSSAPPQSNVNLPTGPQSQEQQPIYPQTTFTSGVRPNQQTPDIMVGENTMGQNPQTGMPQFRKGGYVKAADGIASKGKTRGRMC
jgi:hypothetical protein